MPKALGLVETRGLVAAIEAADAMVKAANVALVGKETTNPALITIKIVGETAAVRSAVDAGSAAAKRVGVLVSTHIIPQPDEQMTTLLPEIKEEPQRKTRRVVKEVPEKKEEVVVPVVKAVQNEEVKEEKKEETKKEEVKKESKPSVAVSDTISRLRKEALGTEEESKKKEKVKPKASPSKKTKIKMEEVELLNVHKLRKFARGVEGFPIQGREISRANRKELLDYFKKFISK